MDALDKMLCTVNVPCAVPITRRRLSAMLSSGTAAPDERHIAVALFTDVPESVWLQYLYEKDDEKRLRLDAALRLLDDCETSHFARAVPRLFFEWRKENRMAKENFYRSDRNGPPWRVLLRDALSILNMSPELNGHWTFGGGTVLSLTLSHRESHDIDIFVDDPQCLSYLSPKFSGEEGHYDETSNYIKIYRPEGEIDFILAPRLLPTLPLFYPKFEGRSVPCEHPLEIVAKKLRYRGDSFTVRDWFDLMIVSERYGLDALRGLCVPILGQPLELPDSDKFFRLNLNSRYKNAQKLDEMKLNMERRLESLRTELVRELGKAASQDEATPPSLDDETVMFTPL